MKRSYKLPINQKGVWKRNVTWFRNGVGRTDIRHNILHDDRLLLATFQFPNGRLVSVSAEDLKKALRTSPSRQDGKIIGPYNIDIEQSKIENCNVDFYFGNTVSDMNFKLEEVENDLISTGVFNPQTIEDARKFLLRSVVQRRGQSRFRSQLLQAYNGKCAISQSDCAHVLEAAHIIPYLGEQTNHVKNGIILRSDLHTLFDLNLLTINEDYTVKVSDVISGDYLKFNGIKLNLPDNQEDWPSQKALLLKRM